jgi:hydroxyacylglutathione hydrolase
LTGYEILPGVNQVPGVTGNSYLLDRDELVLIDSGIPRSSKKIISFIQGNLHKNPRDLKYIILTHYHMDHVGSVADLVHITGAKVAIHEADAGFLTCAISPLPLHGIRGFILEHLMIFFPSKPANPDILLHDWDKIAGLICIHTPGHTPGSISLYDPEIKVLFVGDALTTRKGIISDPPLSATHDLAEAMESAKKISLLDVKVLLSGHGVPVTGQVGEKLRKYCMK